MTADVFYNVAGWLTIAAAVAVVWYYWAHLWDAWRKFRKDFQDALEEGRGPPESPA